MLGQVDPEKGNHMIDSRMNKPEGVAMAHPQDRNRKMKTVEMQQKPRENLLKKGWQPLRLNQSVLGQVDPEMGNRLIDSRMNKPESVAKAHSPDRNRKMKTVEMQQKPQEDCR